VTPSQAKFSGHSQVSLLPNVVTCHISPQFHDMFDDKFETVNSLQLDQTLNKQWAEMFQLGQECFMDIDYNENDYPILPSLSHIIKSYSEAKETNLTHEPTPIIEFDASDVNVLPQQNLKQKTCQLSY
jgi:hypothetical protein